ncbi:MAG TPA: GNAT family N-acetyltransferase [Longimicrobiales bacterium]|nr:GNAT family N-acetyltransferase [Longimicrobiales bacterium]
MSGSAGALLASDAGVALGPATLQDVGGMARLINGFARRGLMLPKTEEELCRHVRDFVVVTDEEGAVVACGGLRIYRAGLAEIVGLAVDESRHGQGLGRTVLEALVAEARALGIATVFAMTLEEAFFHRSGFRTVPRWSIPEKVAADCTGCFRREACREIAVLRTFPGVEGAGRGAQARRLPVAAGG